MTDSQDLQQKLFSAIVADITRSVMQAVRDENRRLEERIDALDSTLCQFDQQAARMVTYVNDVATSLQQQPTDTAKSMAEVDDKLEVLSQRVAQLDTRLEQQDAALAALGSAIQDVDDTALDELEEKVSSAIGEATLVRIEMERLAQATDERADSLVLRMSAVETTLQDQVVDVSTAVQLERLEEIERQLLELDPDQYALQHGQPEPPPNQPAATALPAKPAPPQTSTRDDTRLDAIAAVAAMADRPSLPSRPVVSGRVAS